MWLVANAFGCYFEAFWCSFFTSFPVLFWKHVGHVTTVFPSVSCGFKCSYFALFASTTGTPPTIIQMGAVAARRYMAVCSRPSLTGIPSLAPQRVRGGSLPRAPFPFRE